MTNIPYRISAKSISLIVNNKPTIIPSSHMNFDKLRSALLTETHDLDDIRNLADIPTAIALATSGQVTVFDGLVQYAGQPCHNYLAQRILEHVNSKEPFGPLLKMLELLMLNPNDDIKTDLFKWLEAGDMPITEDGCIVGYKYIGKDYFSSHSGKDGKVLHALHTTVSMPRDQCDESRHNTCSTGLHFCSYGYLGSYTQNLRILIVKVNPTNITAIPKEYGNQKARCCEYDVIGELATESLEDHYRGKQTVDADASIEGVSTQPEGDTKLKKTTPKKSKSGPTKDRLSKDEKILRKEELKGMSFKHAKSGKKFTAYNIWLKIAGKGQRQTATDTGVPRTTLQNWMTAINATITGE